MSQTINTNASSLNAQLNLTKASNALASPIQRLSSGLRINTDRAATTAPTTPAQPAPRSQDQENLSKALRFTDTALSYLSDTRVALNDMRSLAALSLSDDITAEDQELISQQFLYLKQNALKPADEAEIDGRRLLETASDQDNTVSFGDTKFDLSSIALTNKDNPDEGILTKSYNGLSLTTSQEFNISGSSTAQIRGDIVKALDQMISATEAAEVGLLEFREGSIRKLSGSPSDRDLGIYSPTSVAQKPRDLTTSSNLTQQMIERQSSQAILSQQNFQNYAHARPIYL